MTPHGLSIQSKGTFTSLSWSPGRSADTSSELAAAWQELATTLAEEGYEVLLERIYVAPDSFEDVLALRQSALSARGLEHLSEPTILVNRPCLPVPCAAFQYLAWKPTEGGQVRSIPTSEGGPARLLESGGDRALFLGGDPREDLSGLAPMFERTVAQLRAQGFSFRDVARTWLYVEDLLGTYDELNSVRNRVFSSEGLGEPGHFEQPPASTGIQGFHPEGRPCFMETLAVQSKAGGRPFKPIEPELQCEAWVYGSTFSRGMRVPMAGGELTTLSGTASIDASGATAHDGDSRAQILRTMSNIDNLLAACDKPPRPAGLWTIYFKTLETWEAWQELVNEGAVAPVTGAYVFADICRDDLLFEAEVTLVI
ncbi:MAG: hypothetical protein VX498_11935 [Myxococcota bacterium]|nr:hypothetical protein [Myxococcota bacterium]